MGKKNFLVDADKCSGCKLCIVACKDEHVGNAFPPWSASQPDTGHFWVDVVPVERGKIPRVRMTYLPVLCQHCENAPCIKACPEDAIKTRDDGLVWIDPEKCSGCGLCQEACPYDVIYMNDELDIAQKCTGCAHRVDEGALPRCVEVCPHDAILFSDEDDDAAGTGGYSEIYHPEYQTEPRVYWKGIPKPWIAGNVIDAAADEVLTDAEVRVTDLFGDGDATARTDAFGDFWVRKLVADRKYRIAIRKPGYDEFVAVVTTDGEQDLGTVGLEKSR